MRYNTLTITFFIRILTAGKNHGDVTDEANAPARGRGDRDQP